MVVPERVDMNTPKSDYYSDATEPEWTLTISIIRSKIFVVFKDFKNLRIMDIKNIVHSVASEIANAASLFSQLGLSIAIDSAVDIKTEEITIFGAEEPVFLKTDEDIIFTYRYPSSKEFAIPNSIKNDQFFARATQELRNSIVNFNYTAMHCKLAIEAIRNSFEGINVEPWGKMRQALKLKKETLKSFDKISDDQRHGRNRPQTWEERQFCMKIAWEVVNRYLIYKTNPEMFDKIELF